MDMVIPNIEASKPFRPQSDYAADVAADFAQIEPYLPDTVRSILDIGCGLAGIDVLLKRRYPDAWLALLDSDGNAPVYGYGEAGNAYGARAAAEELLAANGIKADQWFEAGTKARLQFDLIVSTVAWGFHFPIRMYDAHGFCIADLRKNYEPVRGEVIYENEKIARCAWHN